MDLLLAAVIYIYLHTSEFNFKVKLFTNAFNNVLSCYLCV